MMGPGALVLLSPLAIGFVFGPRAVCGLLAGSMFQAFKSQSACLIVAELGTMLKNI
jgi:Na+/H+-translocating membrane pyrophosphatase